MRRSKGERGASLVEFALVLPVLVILLFGIIDFGFAFNSYIEVRSGAREGARLAAVNNGCAATSSGCVAADTAERDDLMADTRERITGLADADDVGINISFPDAGAKEAGNNVAVCLVYPFDSVTGLFSFLNIDLKSKGVMRLEQTATFASGGDSVTC
ncbi:MAG: TadE/TadG family type IV pilus assembly protein [Acidimicrobiia bacterium]